MPDVPVNIEEWGKLLHQAVIQSAMVTFYLGLLILVRLSGLFVVGPVLGMPVVPVNVRVLLTLALTFALAPVISVQQQHAFARMDADHDGRLVREEVPQPLQARFDAAIEQSQLPKNSGLQYRDFYPQLTIPRTLPRLVIVIATEFAIGLVLGLGVTTLLSGLEMAGEMIDQQTGFSLGGVFNPGLETSSGLTGNMLMYFATIVFLVMEPLGGHLLMVSALVETFQTLPVGDAFIAQSAIDLLRDLVHQSCVLGLQVAAPVLAAMSLVSLTMGFLGHTVPQINVLVIGFPIRALLNIFVLAFCFSGVARLVIDLVPATFDQLRLALSGL